MKLREHKLELGYREKMQSIIIARNARVKQKADSVLIISKETRQSYLISTFNNYNTTLFPRQKTLIFD